jgi:hypothetical protein
MIEERERGGVYFFELAVMGAGEPLLVVVVPELLSLLMLFKSLYRELASRIELNSMQNGCSSMCRSFES